MPVLCDLPRSLNARVLNCFTWHCLIVCFLLGMRPCSTQYMCAFSTEVAFRGFTCRLLRRWFSPTGVTKPHVRLLALNCVRMERMFPLVHFVKHGECPAYRGKLCPVSDEPSSELSSDTSAKRAFTSDDRITWHSSLKSKGSLCNKQQTLVYFQDTTGIHRKLNSGADWW